MPNTYYVDTLITERSDDIEKEIILWFTVPRDWAENWCKTNGWASLEVFNANYIWDDSYSMFISAQNAGMLLGTEITSEEVYTL
ncbi:MAG: hypothetical protein J6S14_15490 [Clostridia bacterium]|nr:hypothetical protein [Clostridia bacterium]